MLCVKEGINRIQIPDSMIKVLDVESTDEDWADIVFKKLSAPSEDNKLLGRYLDPDEGAPASYETNPQKKLSGMYQRILIGFGVPKPICKKYVQQSLVTSNKRHTHLIGVADPTGCIPYGQVFIPGCKCDFQPYTNGSTST